MHMEFQPPHSVCSVGSIVKIISTLVSEQISVLPNHSLLNEVFEPCRIVVRYPSSVGLG